MIHSDSVSFPIIRMKKFMKIIASALTLSIVSLQTVSAAPITSYEVYDLPVMYLNVGITRTATTGIMFAAPTRNGSTITIRSMSGAIFEFRQGSSIENIYAEKVMVNQTSKVITLGGTVIRDLCFNQARTFTSCNGGQLFSKGAEIRLSNNARLYNLKANVDRANRFTGSGAVAFSGSGSFAFPTFDSVAERNRQYGISPTDVRVSCMRDIGACQYRIGNSWISFGSGTTINAGFHNAGKVQLIGNNTGALLNRTMTGSAGPYALSPSITKVTSSGALDYGRIPVLGVTGKLATGFLDYPKGLFGEAGSGALTITSGSTAIDFGGNCSYLGQYSSITIATGATLNVKNVCNNGGILMLLVQGNVNVYGTISLSGSGSVGGAAATTIVTSGNTTASNDGSAATAAFNSFNEARHGRGGDGAAASDDAAATGGSGGASTTGSGGSVATVTAGSAVAATVIPGRGLSGMKAIFGQAHGLTIGPGGGGGGGSTASHVDSYTSGTATITSGVGGRGGGALYIACGGTWNFPGTINLSGKAGTAGSIVTNIVQSGGEGEAAGGGGGGGAGSGMGACRTIGNNSGTRTVTGGAGGLSNNTGGGTSTTGDTDAGRGADGDFSVLQSY